MSNLTDVLTKWQNDLAFRSAFKKNPTAALQEANIQLDPDDFNKVIAVLNLEGKDDNEELVDKINK